MSTDDPNPTPDPAPAPDPKPADPPKDYTPPASQADLDRIISDRLARDRERYADYSDLKKKAAEHDKALEAAMTEHEKAVVAARKEGETEASQRANTRLVAAEARALAAESRFRNPAIAIATLDLKGVTVADDGTVDTAAIKAKLKELAESDPYLVDDGKKQGPKPDPTQGHSGDDKPSVARGQQLWEERHKKKTPA